MRWVHVGVNEPDGDRPEPADGDPVGSRRQCRLVQRGQFLPLCADTARDRETILARDQRRGQAKVQVILLERVFSAHLDDIAETLGRLKGSARAAPLDQRIGGQRRAVDHDIQIGGGNPGLGQHDVDAVKDGLLGGAVVRQDLGRVHSPVRLKGDVGESAANVGPKPDLRRHFVAFAASAASRIWESVCRGVSASGEMFRSSTAPVREARARAKAAGKSSVRSTRSA